jgi:predicted negative regulator of RcsB-dependent stress response
MKKIITDNLAVFIATVILAGLAWANRSQLNEISLKQDNAILNVQKADADTFVTKQWFMEATTEQKSAAAATAMTVEKVASDVSDIKTAVAVLKSEVETVKPNK